jgi:hypothetical protein
MEADLGIDGWKLGGSAASTPPREVLVKFWGNTGAGRKNCTRESTIG